MSLEELRKSILQEAQADAKRITEKAEKEAGEKLQAAKAGAGRIVETARARAQRAAEAEKNERQSAVQLRAKKITSEAQNMVLQQGLQKIWKGFSAVPQDKAQYEKLLKKLIMHAEKEMGKNAVVLVNPKDQNMARRFSRNVSGENVQISGGAVVTSEDGAISINNSLESLFAAKEDELRKLVYTEIFGGKKK